MSFHCGECKSNCANEYISAKRLKAKKEWIMKRYPTIVVCWSCFKKNHPEEYLQYLERRKKIDVEYELELQTIKDCIDFRIKNDTSLTEEQKKYIQSVHFKV